MARRVLLVLFLALTAAACHGASDEHLIVVVNTIWEAGDAVPGDGVCEMTVGLGDCSIRAAVDEANANPAMLIVLVPAGDYNLGSWGAEPPEDANADGDLDVNPRAGALLIVSEGANLRRNDADGAVDVHGGALIMWGIGGTDNAGPGVRARAGTTVVTAWGSWSRNEGAGIVVDSGAAVTAGNATFSSNTEGGIENAGALDGRFITVTANEVGGILGGGTVHLTSSIVGDQSSGADCGSAATSRGWNLDSDGTCGLPDATDLPATTTGLSGLSASRLPFHTPLPGSPALDSVPVGSGGCVDANDQRVALRPVGPACASGAPSNTPTGAASSPRRCSTASTRSQATAPAR